MDSKGKDKAKCRLCGLEGHLPEKCPTPNALKVCNFCKKKGHLARTCPTPEINAVCNKCGKKGHTFRNCNIIIWDAPRYIKCSICNEEKHGARDCPVKKQREAAQQQQPRSTSPINSNSSSPSSAGSSSSSVSSSTPSTSPSPSNSVPPKRKEDPKIVEMEKHLQGTVRGRQLRLDFHTSEHLPEVAADFDAAKFAQTIKGANIDCVTVAARCRHGFLYYLSQKNPELVHPNLSPKCNLMVEQVKALHKVGVRAPVSVSLAWDQRSAVRNPEWLAIPAHAQRNVHETTTSCSHDLPAHSQRNRDLPAFYALCLSSPYRDLVRQIVEEIILTLEATRSEGAGFDGLYLDADFARECSCSACLAGVRARGGDPDLTEDRREFAAHLVTRFREDIASLVKKTFQTARFGKLIGKQKKKPYSLVFSCGRIDSSDRRLYESVASHIDVDSPSLEVPARIRYARSLDADTVATIDTGSHHSFISPSSLSFQVSRALAYGAKCNIVDQLHPRGKLNEYTYAQVSSVYKDIEKKDQWCTKVSPVVEVAVFTSEEFGSDLVPTLGATTILEALSYQFDVIDSAANFARYKLLILPDSISVDDKLASKLEAYLDMGGAVIASGRSGFNASGSSVVLKSLGIELVGPAELTPDFVSPGSNIIGKDLPPTEHVMFNGGWKVNAAKFSLVKEEKKEELTSKEKGKETEKENGNESEKEKEKEENGENGKEEGGDDGEEEKEKHETALKVPNGVSAPAGESTEYTPEVLASIVEPYFSRSWDHFTGDAHAPSSGKVFGPAVVYTANRRVLYFAHSIFTQFWKHSSPWMSKLVENAVQMLLPEQIIKTPGSPSTLVSSVLQSGKTKYIVHLLHYVPRRVGSSSTDVEAVPLYNVRVELRLPGLQETQTTNSKAPVFSLDLVPEGKPIEFERKEGGEFSFVVPQVVGHQMICLTIK